MRHLRNPEPTRKQQFLHHPPSRPSSRPIRPTHIQRQSQQANPTSHHWPIAPHSARQKQQRTRRHRQSRQHHQAREQQPRSIHQKPLRHLPPPLQHLEIHPHPPSHQARPHPQHQQSPRQSVKPPVPQNSLQQCHLRPKPCPTHPQSTIPNLFLNIQHRTLNIQHRSEE